MWIFFVEALENCAKDAQNVQSAVTDIHKFWKKFGIICFDLFGVEGLCSSECGCNGGDYYYYY
jgi:hypothetical protein